MSGTITFGNELTIEHLSVEMERLKNAVRNWDEIMVDVSDAGKVDIAALQMLIASKKECQETGHRIIFKMSDTVKNAMASAGIRL